MSNTQDGAICAAEGACASILPEGTGWAFDTLASHMTAPKLFISYSWSAPDHEQWVLDLASELVDSGVDVILDKWDLREGHDAVAFMEKMVSDPSITKVVIVSDKTYASKANGRTGGVGTETQIISKEVYERTAQDKFVAVVSERDPDGKPYLPTYYTSRIYIDLSESDTYAENFEKLLRWVFDKPIYVKPELGKPPAFLDEEASLNLGTSALARRATDAIRNDKGYAQGALGEYLVTFALNVERLRLVAKEGELDDQVVSAIDAFTPSRNEFLHVLGSMIQYGKTGEAGKTLHRFIESLLPYYTRAENQNSWNELEFDHFKFIVHELFLYCVALLVRHEDYGSVNHLLTQPYYLAKNIERGRGTTVSFTAIREYMRSLEHRNGRLGLRRLSLRADLLEQRSKATGIPFRYVMQADFICFMRAELTGGDDYDRWWPETLLYAGRHYGAFEMFARCTSKTQLVSVLPLLGVTSLEPIRVKLQSYDQGRRSLPRWEFESINPSALLGFDQLGTKA